MTWAGRSRSRSLALPVSARTCRTWSSGNVPAITPRLTWSLTRMPAGKPAAARAIAANPARDAGSVRLLLPNPNGSGSRVELRSSPEPRRPDDRRETATGRAAGEGRRWRLPAQRGRGRAAAADGGRRGGPGRRGPPRAHGRAPDLPERLPGAGARHPARDLAAAGAEAADRAVLLPALPGAAEDQREGPGRRHPGGVDRRR